MSKLKRPLLVTYLAAICILYFIGFITNIVFLYKGLFVMGLSVIIAFSDVQDAVSMLSGGICQIIVSLCLFGLMYALLIGSIVSPFYVNTLIGRNKLPIGRKKS